MNEMQQKLLADGIIILPSEVDHETYEMMAEALLCNQDTWLRLFCAGDGGSIRDGLAIVDLIRAHGRVMGILAGAAVSVHGVIWASCVERYVYPHAILGIHKVGYSELNRALDTKTAGQLSRELERYERAIAQIYWEACSPDFAFKSSWWYEKIQAAGRDEFDILNSYILQEYGMARSIGNLRSPKGASERDNGATTTPPPGPLPAGREGAQETLAVREADPTNRTDKSDS